MSKYKYMRQIKRLKISINKQQLFIEIGQKLSETGRRYEKEPNDIFKNEKYNNKNFKSQ